MDDNDQNKDYQNDQNKDYQNDQNKDYQNEGYHNEQYQNDTTPEKSSHTREVHSTSENVKKESVASDQGWNNASEQEYEYIPLSSTWMKTLPEEELNADPGLYIFGDVKLRSFPRKPFIIFCIVLVSSLIMATVALVMTCHRCKPVCSDGWEKFQEKCYYFSEERKTWFESRKFCQKESADLVVIDHKEKQTFLEKKKKTGKDIWIGLKYEAAEKVWKWVDGKSFSYPNWLAEPPKYDAECLTIGQQNNKWNNYHCVGIHASPICEKSRHVACVLQSPFWPQ
nr:perlucin-like protein [Anolis sagrei ordinatus]